MRSYQIVMLSLVVLVTMGCTDYNKLNDITLGENEVELAIPLVNTEFSVNDFVGDGGTSTNNVDIKVDNEDRVTVVYRGDVVRQNVSAIFPAIPFFGFPLPDTSFTSPVPFGDDQRVDKAIFGNSNLLMNIVSQYAEDIVVTLRVLELTKDGQQFSTTFTVPYQGSVPVNFNSMLIPVKGWTLQSENSELTIIYDARKANNERVKFSSAALFFDQVKFDYLEGYFGNEVFDINGDFIPIGVLDTWVSGGLAFEEPKVNIKVENAFGFPVRSKFNVMQVVTTTGEKLNMESDIIDNNIDFAYPAITEQGEVKVTQFSFDKDNSNIVELFKERVVRVTYDIDAQANPDGDQSIVGYVNEDSYFLVNVDVELPLEGTVNNLVLQNTIDLDLTSYDQVTSAEFKNIIANGFPADIELQGYFLNDDGQRVDSLFGNGLILPAAPINPSTGKATMRDEQIFYEDFDSDRFSKITNTKRMEVRIKINTTDTSNGPLWIYQDYGILFKIGAKMKTSL